MSFGPAAMRGGAAGGTGGVPGQVDFRLARNAVVKELRKGRLARHDVCDAHPELLRAARNVGTPTDETCPVCEDATLVHVTYAFGAHLPASGRCITTGKELASAARTAGEAACYVVEVCPACAWNHLTRTFTATRAARRAVGRS